MNAPADILVVGAGPTGLALALQAHEHGAKIRIVDRRSEVFRPSRALILHPRTLEVLRPLGVTESLLERADTAPEVTLHLGPRTVPARLDRFVMPDTAFPHLTLVRQLDAESVLLAALTERGVLVERGTEVIDVQEDVDGVSATLMSSAGIETARCAYLAGCDGPASLVRENAGIAWPGGPYGQEVVLADVELDGDFGGEGSHAVAGRDGLLFVFALGEHATWRLLVTRPAGSEPLPFGQPGPPVSVDELQRLLEEAGLAARITKLAWSARYRVQHRLAERFRAGRIFLAGDAAHAYSPATGQGMNTGIQDALNLGWKLAFAAHAPDPEVLLDSYERERRPVVSRALRLTHMTFWLEASPAWLPSLLRARVAPLGAPLVPFILRCRRLIGELIGTMGQLRAAYRDSPISIEGLPPLETGPRTGQRMPDMPVTVDGRAVQLHELLAQPGVHVLLHRDAVRLEDQDFGPHVVTYRLASVPGTGLIAVRPDGYVGCRSGVANAAQLNAWLARIGAGTVSPRGVSALAGAVS